MENKRVVLASRPKGWVTEENFRLETAPLPKPAEGELLVKNLWLSLDPYMRGRMDDVKSYVKGVDIGEVMVGQTVGEVIESRNEKFKRVLARIYIVMELTRRLGLSKGWVLGLLIGVTALSARASCTNPSTTAKMTITRMAIASTPSPRNADKAVAMSRMMINTFLNCSKKISQGEICRAACSSLGP